MTDNENKFLAFLSYSHQDNREQRSDTQAVSSLCWGDWLHDALKTFSIPAEFVGQVNGRGEIIPERIHPVFRDEQELPEDAKLSADIRKALEQSICLIVICSPRSAESLHVNEAVRYFKQLGRGKHILPIVVAGEPNASDGTKPGRSPEDECFVPALRHPVQPDGTLDPTRRAGRYIFVDARQGDEKREMLAKDHRNAEADLEMAKIQLIALLMGVGFNGLWWREQKRHFFDFAEAQRQLLEAQRQTRETQNKALEIQSLPRDVHSQIQEAQNQALEAQNQARETQKQLQEIQNKVRDTQAQLEEARSRALAAESKVLEARNQARDAQIQLEETRNQAREAQNQVLEIQNPPQDVPNQIQEAQNQVLEAQDQASQTQKQLQEFQIKVRDTQTQLEEARNQALAAESKFLEAQSQAQNTQGQLQETRKQAQDAHDKFLEAQCRLDKNQTARRLTQVLALIAVLVALAASIAWWQRKSATQALAKAAATEVREADPAADNFTNTLARLNDLKPAPGERIYALLFQRWAAQDPVQAIAQRQQIPGHDADARILSAIMAVWVDQQPAAALNWLESQPDSESLPVGTWRNTIIAELFGGWAAKDLEAATAACQQLADDTAREKAWECVLSQRIVKAPASAAEPVRNLPAGDYRQKAIIELCNHWVGTNTPAVLDWAQSLPMEAERVAATNQILVNWARQDPPAAAQFADQHPELSGAAFGEIAIAWFQSDLTATTNWVASLPDGEKKDAALLALVETWAQQDPKGMATYALGLPAGHTQTRYLTAACGQLAMRDLPATVDLLQPLSDAALRQSILEQAARGCDLPHVNQAAKYIAAMPAGDDQKAVLKGLLSSWAQADSETAVNWLCSFPETNSQPEQVQFVIKAWSQREPAAAAHWLATAPAGTPSEGMVSAFLEGAVGKYPEFAWQWTQSLTDETKRQKFQLQVAWQWMQTDPSAALKWINSLDLP